MIQFSNMKRFIIVLMLAVSIFAASYHVFDAKQSQASDFYAVADNTCPGDPGTCSSSGGG